MSHFDGGAADEQAEYAAAALRRIVQGEIEASLQDAVMTVAENLAEIQKQHGWSNREVAAVLLAEDEALMKQFRVLGFASAWDDRC